MTCLVGVGRRRGPEFAHRGEVVIRDLRVKSPHPTDRTHGEVGPRKQAPEAALLGVGMAFMQVLPLAPDRKPPLPRGLRAPLVVHEPGSVCGLQAGDPPIHGRA